MYSIIIAIHAVFVVLSHILGYRFFEALFLLLCIFFLFYFSPLFFLEGEWKTLDSKKNIFEMRKFLEKFSPKDSIIIPLTLLYTALYIFVIGLFGTGYSLVVVHSILALWIFLILFGYILSFDWKNDMFSEIFHYHLILTFFSTIIFGILWFFEYIPIPVFALLLSLIGIIAGIFYLTFFKNSPFYTSFFLIFLISTLFLLFQFIFYFHSSFLLLSIAVIFGIISFEYFPNLSIFSLQTHIIRYFSLILVLITIPFLLFLLVFSDITFPFLLLIPTTFFLFSIHIRYSNYITYPIGLGIIYFLYSIFFLSLLSPTSLFSVLLFIFFLPFLLIGMSYFWEEQYPYDFIILHYSSIMFSGMYSIYSIFFIWWGMNLLFVISACILGLAVLFFLSYFRFRKV